MSFLGHCTCSVSIKSQFKLFQFSRQKVNNPKASEKIVAPPSGERWEQAGKP
jgi:hypothetical protein